MGGQLKAERDWAPVRADYEGSDLSLDEICARHGISRSALSWRVKKQMWTMRHRSPATDRGQLIARMFRVLERQVIQLDGAEIPPSEPDVALLGAMAKTLEKLIELEKSARRPGDGVRRGRDMAALRAKLARRLERPRHE